MYYSNTNNTSITNIGTSINTNNTSDTSIITNNTNAFAQTVWMRKLWLLWSNNTNTTVTNAYNSNTSTYNSNTSTQLRIWMRKQLLQL